MKFTCPTNPVWTNEEEYAEMERQREAARQAKIAPFRAVRRRMNTGLRYAVANDAVTDEELIDMSAVTPEWQHTT